MKKLLLFLTVLMGVGTAIPMAQTAPIAAAAAKGQETSTYQASLDEIRKNAPLIVAKIQTILPHVKTFAEGAKGGLSGLWNTVSTAITDSKAREVAVELVALLTSTVAAVSKLAFADVSIQEKAKQSLQYIAKDQAVRELLANAKQIPYVGNALHDKLQELLTKIATLK